MPGRRVRAAAESSGERGPASTPASTAVAGPARRPAAKSRRTEACAPAARSCRSARGRIRRAKAGRPARSRACRVDANHSRGIPKPGVVENGSAGPQSASSASDSSQVGSPLPSVRRKVQTSWSERVAHRARDQPPCGAGEGAGDVGVERTALPPFSPSSLSGGGQRRGGIGITARRCRPAGCRAGGRHLAIGDRFSKVAARRRRRVANSSLARTRRLQGSPRRRTGDFEEAGVVERRSARRAPGSRPRGPSIDEARGFRRSGPRRLAARPLGRRRGLGGPNRCLSCPVRGKHR